MAVRWCLLCRCCILVISITHTRKLYLLHAYCQFWQKIVLPYNCDHYCLQFFSLVIMVQFMPVNYSFRFHRTGIQTVHTFCHLANDIVSFEFRHCCYCYYLPHCANDFALYTWILYYYKRHFSISLLRYFYWVSVQHYIEHPKPLYQQFI